MVFRSLDCRYFCSGIDPGRPSIEYRLSPILALSYWAIGGTYLLLAGFNAAKRKQMSFGIDILKYWGIRLPIVLIATPATTTFTILGIEITPGQGVGIETIFWL